MRGTGAVAIWHDIAEEGRDAFYDWHGHEHMLERVAIPGFLRGRRYVAVEAPLEFFNIYEAEDLSVLKGTGYRERLDNPTPWTVETVQHFRNVHRALTTVTHSEGIGGGGLVATWHYDGEGGEAADAALWRHVLLNVKSAPGVAGVHFLAADRGASVVDTKERQARGGSGNIVPNRTLLVEGWGDEQRFHDLCCAALDQERLAALGVEGAVAFGLYKMQLTVDAR